MGCLLWVVEVFNCSVLDSGNMELLQCFVDDVQCYWWLMLLLEGEICFCFVMSELDVVFFDVINIVIIFIRDGDDYLIDGCKWFIIGVVYLNCWFVIVLGCDDQVVE